MQFVTRTFAFAPCRAIATTDHGYRFEVLTKTDLLDRGPAIANGGSTGGAEGDGGDVGRHRPWARLVGEVVVALGSNEGSKGGSPSSSPSRPLTMNRSHFESILR